MLVWLKVKTAISNWCKKYWQILVGFFGAILAVVVFSGGSNREIRKILDAKNELKKKEEELDKILREEEDEAIKRNIAKFFAADEKAKNDFEEKLHGLDNQQRKRVKELLESDNPEEVIANGLRGFLDQEIQGCMLYLVTDFWR